jgi:UDPglucose 6-dehydrogenase
VDATIAANRNQMDRMIAKIVAAVGRSPGRRVALLGLAFKPNTDDLRAAPALHILAGLKRRGIRVRAFDPVAMENARGVPVMRGVELAKDPYDCARGADAVAIVTEWNEFRNMNLARLKRIMRRPVLCDLRNIYDPAEVEKAGLVHVGVGRGRAGAGRARAPRRSTGRRKA